MKAKNLAFYAGVFCMVASAACAQKGEGRRGGKAGEMKTEMDSISYVFGTSLGSNIRQSEIEGVNVDQVMHGLEDALKSDSNMAINMQDGQNLVRNYMTGLQKKKGEASMKKSEAYMNDLASNDKLQSTESGIYYEVVTMGEGEKPVPTDKVKVNYEGKTTDGNVFDSSYERGTPAEFPLNRVIAGWTEILQEMPVGSTFIATIPPALAYGERGSPPNIGANEVLIFKIELLEILPADQPAVTPGQ